MSAMSGEPGFAGKRLLVIGLVAGWALGASAVLGLVGIRWFWSFVPAIGILLAVHFLTEPGRPLNPRSWVRGVDGEHLISQLLADLEQYGFKTIDHVDIGYGDVDHVVVGPSGILAVETKNWPGRYVYRDGTLLRNGKPCMDPVRQAIRGAIAVRELLKARWVEAVLVMVSADIRDSPIALSNVTIVGTADLARLLLDAPRRLSASQIDETARVLHELSGRPRTRKRAWVQSSPISR